MINACYLHKHTEATGHCSACRRPICTRCSFFADLQIICPPCGVDVRPRVARRRAALLFGMVGFFVVAIAGVMLFLARQVTSPSQVRGALSGAATIESPPEIERPQRREAGPSREVVERTSNAARAAEAQARLAAAEAALARSRAEATEARAREATAIALTARAATAAEREHARAVEQAARTEVLQARREVAAADRDDAAARQAEARARLGAVGDGDPGCVMPTERRGNSMLVEVDLDGSVARMILDTGATHTLVTAAFADAARLAIIEGERRAASTANGETEIGLARIGTLDIAGRTLSQHIVGVCENCALRDADGLLGVDVMRAMHVQVDLPSGTARFGDCR